MCVLDYFSTNPLSGVVYSLGIQSPQDPDQPPGEEWVEQLRGYEPMLREVASVKMCVSCFSHFFFLVSATRAPSSPISTAVIETMIMAMVFLRSKTGLSLSSVFFFLIYFILCFVVCSLLGGMRA